MHKLEDCVGGDCVAHVHARLYEAIGAERPNPKFLIGAGGDAVAIFGDLAQTLRPPYFVLYVLHTSRGEGEVGRYESEEVDRLQLADFIGRYQAFLIADGRFDIWVRSPTDSATIVWDRHNYIHAYGPLDRYSSILEAAGYAPGEVDRIAQREHLHHYRPELDHLATDLLNEFEWDWSPLRPADEQI
ncbi:MAG TPA: hypothetical protein VGO52_21300 [Hyphomonadaceae bacterium]|jgi:hypothetical protein|nr:hypothetical protein [Hyphomonadaceae bacterium]